LSNLDPPFFYMERDVVTHTPYNKKAAEISVSDYFAQHKSTEDFQEDYQSAIKETKLGFIKRVEQLRSRGLLESTLIIFTAAHGELLGEYGDFGHNTPVSPELIYVPTFVSHPSLDARKLAVDSDKEIIEHVDLAETINQVLDCGISTSGCDIISEGRHRDHGYSHMDIKHNGDSLYRSDGVWQPDGGHMFLTSDIKNRLKYAAYATLRSPTRKFARRHPLATLKAYLPDYQLFGSPSISKSDAQEYMSQHKTQAGNRGSERIKLTNSAKSRLQDMGYI